MAQNKFTELLDLVDQGKQRIEIEGGSVANIKMLNATPEEIEEIDKLRRIVLEISEQEYAMYTTT